jgi:DNA polymerase-3 subunit alpha
MPELDELPQGEISKLEKEYLGLYLTNHPLSSVETLYRDFITSDIAVCLEGTEEKKVILCGIITSYRQTITKRGEMMASFVLEDLTGTIEVLVFPKIFAEVTNLQNDSIVIVKGRYYINEDEKKIFAEKITGLNEIKSEVRVNSDTKNGSIYGENIIPESPGRLMLRIAGEDNEMFGKILKLVKNFSGEIPVCIFFEGTRKLYKLSPEYNVNNSQGFYQNITALLGQNNVKWQ